jgi:hypothetical protein
MSTPNADGRKGITSVAYFGVHALGVAFRCSAICQARLDEVVPLRIKGSNDGNFLPVCACMQTLGLCFCLPRYRCLVGNAEFIFLGVSQYPHNN